MVNFVSGDFQLGKCIKAVSIWYDHQIHHILIPKIIAVVKATQTVSMYDLTYIVFLWRKSVDMMSHSHIVT